MSARYSFNVSDEREANEFVTSRKIQNSLGRKINYGCGLVQIAIKKHSSPRSP
jgi:hypothetical protein